VAAAGGSDIGAGDIEAEEEGEREGWWCRQEEDENTHRWVGLAHHLLLHVLTCSLESMPSYFLYWGLTMIKRAPNPRVVVRGCGFGDLHRYGPWPSPL
jgi:hypothetical protein